MLVGMARVRVGEESTYTCGCCPDDNERKPVEPSDDEEVAEVERLVLEPGAIWADGEDTASRLEEAIALALVFVRW